MICSILFSIIIIQLTFLNIIECNKNDVILTLNLLYEDIHTLKEEEIVFSLEYKSLKIWKRIVISFCNQYSITKCYILENAVREKLEVLSFNPILIKQGSNDNNDSNIIDEEINNNEMIKLYSEKIIQEMNNVLSNKSNIYNENEKDVLLFTIGHGKHSRKYYNTYNINKANLLPSKSILPEYLRNNRKIIFYQTRNAITGGTIALQLLYERLTYLGYDALMCNDTNFQSIDCTDINNSNLVITGEWCHEILDDYNVSNFAGQGIQYFLGFHHANDYCRGHIAIADSQYISVDLGIQVLGAYYLGCAMTPDFEIAHKEMSDNYSNIDMVLKEDLIIIDYDYFKDYPPLSCCLEFKVPFGYRIVYAKNIPRNEMPILLKRAKIVLDLAMPGPERLAGEGILMAAIPIVSKRWNGASFVDFPGVIKVDHQNQSDIEIKIKYVADNYQSLITDENNLEFFSYIKSMWHRVTDTVDVVFGSSRIHFVIFAKNLEDEQKASLQCLALLYLFPLATIDLFVTDIYWFTRHHYKFYTILKKSGYIRFDPHNPIDNKYMSENLNHGLSFVNIRQYSSEGMEDIIDKLSTYQNIPWKPSIVFIPIGIIFHNPYILLHTIQNMDEFSSRFLIESDNNNNNDDDDLCKKYQSYNKLLIIQRSASFNDTIKNIIISIAIDHVCVESGFQKYFINSSFTNVCDLYHISNSDFMNINTTTFVMGVVKSTNWHDLIYTLDNSELNLC